MVSSYTLTHSLTYSLTHSQGDIRPFIFHNEKQILNSKQTFDNFDTDRNGLISFSEFVNAISECEMYNEFSNEQKKLEQKAK